MKSSVPPYYHPCDVPHAVAIPHIGRVEVAAILLAKLGMFLGALLALVAVVLIGVRFYNMNRQQKVDVNIDALRQAEQRLIQTETNRKNGIRAIYHANYALRNTHILNSLFEARLSEDASYSLSSVNLKAYSHLPIAASRAPAASKKETAKAPEKREPLLAYHLKFEWVLGDIGLRAQLDQLAKEMVSRMRPDFSAISGVQNWTIALQSDQSESAAGGFIKLTHTGTAIAPGALYQVQKGVKPDQARAALEAFYTRKKS